jgi:pimeloyl-ACP methyl ester carboxylesterase
MTSLYHELEGAGEPIVIVHGGWTGQAVWAAAAADLARSFRVVRYDRLGYNASPPFEGPVLPRRRHEDDLIALIDSLDLAPAHLVGTSYGALTILGVAARRPDLVRRVVAHEGPALELTDDPAVRAAREAMDEAARIVESGDVLGGTRHFFEQVALGPGAWETFPEAFRNLALNNAHTFLAEARDPEWAAVDVAALEPVADRILLTQGDASPAWFPVVMDALGDVLPGAVRATVRGAGHSPHGTHPDAYAALIASWLREEAPPAR